MSNQKKLEARGQRLGTRLRGQMAEAYDRRGHGSSNLYLHYSPKRQANVCLAGNLHYLHFLLAESDTEIKHVDYNPRAIVARIGGEMAANLVHAQVSMRDGSLVWRRLVQHDASEPEGLQDLVNAVGTGLLKNIQQLQILTDQQLTDKPIRLWNTQAALGWVVAAKHWPLHTFRLEVLSRLSRDRRLTFGDVLRMGSTTHSALYAAAALTAALKGEIASDLDVRPFSSLTAFYRRGA